MEDTEINTVEIQGRQVPASVNIGLITIRQAGIFLPGIREKIKSVEVTREKRNELHAQDARKCGLTFLKETTEAGKELVHAGVQLGFECLIPGATISKMIKDGLFEGKAVEVEDPGKKPSIKIELRPSGSVARRYRREGQLTKEDLATLAQNLENQLVRMGRIWVNPHLDPTTEEVVHSANIMIGFNDPIKFAGLPQVDPPVNENGNIDLAALLALKDEPEQQG